MARPSDASPEQLADFANAITDARNDLGISQAGIAALVAGALGESIHQTTVSNWMSGKHEPTRSQVEILEQVMRVERGSFSRLLGWLPADAVPLTTVPDAIAHDPALTPQGRQAVLAVYETMVSEATAVRRARALRSKPADQ